MRHALEIVNANKIGAALRASGVVDGHFTTPQGRRHRFHLDATLFYLAPRYVRFDLKKFGDRQILFGSNDVDYWFYAKEDDAYYCGHHGVPEDLPPEVPIRPDRIGDALGLNPIRADSGRTGPTQLVQRVVDDYQQILLLVHDEQGRLMLEREYWLDRYPPQLVRRVVFRDADGVVEMESQLQEYGFLTPGGPLLPGVMIADWPKSRAHLRFRVAGWAPVDQVKADAVQFATPRECGEQ